MGEMYELNHDKFGCGRCAVNRRSLSINIRWHIIHTNTHSTVDIFGTISRKQNQQTKPTIKTRTQQKKTRNIKHTFLLNSLDLFQRIFIHQFIAYASNTQHIQAIVIHMLSLFPSLVLSISRSNCRFIYTISFTHFEARHFIQWNVNVCLILLWIDCLFCNLTLMMLCIEFGRDKRGSRSFNQSRLYQPIFL